MAAVYIGICHDNDFVVAESVCVDCFSAFCCTEGNS